MILFVPGKNNEKSYEKHCDTVAVDIIMTWIKVIIMFIFLFIFLTHFVIKFTLISKHFQTTAQSQRARIKFKNI